MEPLIISVKYLPPISCITGFALESTDSIYNLEEAPSLERSSTYANSASDKLEVVGAVAPVVRLI